MSRKAIPPKRRFWAKVDKSGDCWEWTAGVMSAGYGMFHPSKKESVLAHRYAYEQARGSIPAGLHIDHLCRNRKCVNPSHLEAVDQIENSRRGLSWRLRNGMDDSCINGHKYTADNTYVEPDGISVRCRDCSRERDRHPKRNASLRRRIYAERKAA